MNFTKQATEIIESAGYDVSEIRDFLDRLRESGETNMYGSGDYLTAHFGFPKRDTRAIVMAYMKSGLREAA